MEEEKNNEQKQDQQIESKLKDMGREVEKSKSNCYERYFFCIIIGF